MNREQVLIAGTLLERKESINKLLSTNVNNHTEKKGNLTYLSWAWAWAEALKADEDATYKVEMFGDKCYMDINGTAMVFVTVTMFRKPVTCQLPVMDYKNKAILNPDAFAVNTAIMRCMTKALSLHGLGLYIYAGEDLPEGEGSDIDVNSMIDHLAAIEAASSIEELKNVYTTAYSACGADKAWQKKVIDAKEKRKGALK
jgi:Protein of unknown function (DUF1071)